MIRFATWSAQAWVSTFWICALTASAALALPPDDAEMIFVRKDCSSFFASSVCVESMADANSWLTTRTAGAVQIDIGPGDWGRFECNGENNVTVRGAGRQVTRLVDPGTSGMGMAIDSCDRFDASSLTAHGAFAGVQWKGPGTSTWSDTDLIGGGVGFDGDKVFSLGWYDYAAGCPGAPNSTHYFFGSRVRALGNAQFNIPFYARCAEHWFYGGEILAAPEVESGALIQEAVLLRQYTVFQSFGTAIRSTSGTTANTQFNPFWAPSGGLHAVMVQGSGATFHSHGGIISAIAEGSSLPVDVTGIQTLPGAAIAHTPDTAFVVKAGPGGSAARLIDGGGVAQSPFLWQQDDEPPRAEPGNPSSPFVTSSHGADLFVETDCSATQCSSGSQPHLLIYSDSCTGADGPWFDVVTGSCRVN